MSWMTFRCGRFLTGYCPPPLILIAYLFSAFFWSHV